MSSLNPDLSFLPTKMVCLPYIYTAHLCLRANVTSLFSTAPLGQRFRLISAPMSEGKVFGLAGESPSIRILTSAPVYALYYL